MFSHRLHAKGDVQIRLGCRPTIFVYRLYADERAGRHALAGLRSTSLGARYAAVTIRDDTIRQWLFPLLGVIQYTQQSSLTTRKAKRLLRTSRGLFPLSLGNQIFCSFNQWEMSYLHRMPTSGRFVLGVSRIASLLTKPAHWRSKTRLTTRKEFP